jgi:transposase InsO family protein
MFSVFRYHHRQQEPASRRSTSADSPPEAALAVDAGLLATRQEEALAAADDDRRAAYASAPEAHDAACSPTAEEHAPGTVEETRIEPDATENLEDEASYRPDADESILDDNDARHPLLAGPRARGRRLAKKGADVTRHLFTAEQRLLLLDTWRRSGLPAKDFAALVGISKHTLYKWKQLFEQQGPAGLADQPRGAGPGSRLPELTRRTILMLKESHPEWGCERISDMLLRGPALPASPSSVARVLHEAGYEMVDQPTHRHPDQVRRFERAKPNQLWQTDLFTFVLKRQNRRVYLVMFMDDHSRFIVSYGLHASASTALVLEALEAGLAAYGPPAEILTDNGPQYVTWRGTSQFTRHLQKQGIKQIVARPRRPQTLGKIERFWGTLWREFLETAVFLDLAEARTRIGHFIDHYNFQRAHQGINGLVPADRFFGAAQDVLRTLKERVLANALELARHGAPQQPFYVTGNVDGQAFSVHAEGPRLVLRRDNEPRQEITLSGEAAPRLSEASVMPAPVCPAGSPVTAPAAAGTEQSLAPGASALDSLVLAPRHPAHEQMGGDA